MIEAILSKLEQRLGGRLYARQRLGIETDHEAQIFGQGLTFFHLENWYSIHSVIRTLFKLTGLYWRGRANAARVQVRHNGVRLKRLPAEFDGLTLLHMSDFHADMNEGAMRRVEEILPASTENRSVRQINMTISLAFLAPNLVQAAVDGRLPRGVGIANLRDAPAEWSRQYARLGLALNTFLNRHCGARNRIFSARDRGLNSAYPAGRRPDTEDHASNGPR